MLASAFGDIANRAGKPGVSRPVALDTMSCRGLRSANAEARGACRGPRSRLRSARRSQQLLGGKPDGPEFRRCSRDRRVVLVVDKERTVTIARVEKRNAAPTFERPWLHRYCLPWLPHPPDKDLRSRSCEDGWLRKP